MSDCTAIYPAKPIECLRDAGHDGDHAGQDDAGFQVYWSKPNADMVPAARLEEAERLLAQWTTAADYDRERTTPASEEAHDLWARIDDKPHFALPTIQAVLDQRDAANLEIARLRKALEQIAEGAPDRKPDIEAMLASDDRDGIALVSEELEHYRCATIARAALTPKEPSDG